MAFPPKSKAPMKAAGKKAPPPFAAKGPAKMAAPAKAMPAFKSGGKVSKKGC